MSQSYNLECLDLLISVTLNPSNSDTTCFTKEQIDAIKSSLSVEKLKFQPLIKNHVFRLTKESQIQLLIKKYHSTLIILLDDAFEYKSKIDKKISYLKGYMMSS